MPDVTRPLNDRGKKAAAQIGHYLAKKHEKPDLIVSSPAARAYHTAVVVARLLGYRSRHIQVEPPVYYDGEQGVMNTLRKIDARYHDVFVFGHEPTCSDLIEAFTGEHLLKFPTCSVCRIELDIDQWSDIYDARGKKTYLISPKKLKV